MTKKFVRVLGLDDGSFSRSKDLWAPLIGVVYRLDGLIEKIYRRRIQVDGTDVSDSIIDIIREYGGKLAITVSEGVTFGGFNIPDIKYIFENTGVPYISYLKRRPSMSSIEDAMKKYGLHDNFNLLRKLNLRECHFEGVTIYLNVCGLNESEAFKLLLKTIHTGRKSEPVRIADMIGRII